MHTQWFMAALGASYRTVHSGRGITLRNAMAVCASTPSILFHMFQDPIFSTSDSKSNVAQVGLDNTEASSTCTYYFLSTRISLSCKSSYRRNYTVLIYPLMTAVISFQIINFLSLGKVKNVWKSCTYYMFRSSIWFLNTGGVWCKFFLKKSGIPWQNKTSDLFL